MLNSLLLISLLDSLFVVSANQSVVVESFSKLVHSGEKSVAYSTTPGPNKTTIKSPSEKSTGYSTEKKNENTTDNLTIKPTDKTTVETTKKSTDSQIEKVTERTTEKSTKYTTGNPIKEVTEVSKGTTQQNYSHKATEDTTRNSTEKPHITNHRSHGEDKGDENGNTSDLDNTSSEESTEYSTKKSTDGHMDKVTDRTTEKFTKNTTDNPIKEVPEASTGKATEKSTKNTTDIPVKKTCTKPNNLHKTTQVPTKCCTQKPHSAENRKGCAENEKYEQRPNTVRKPQTCECLGDQCEDNDEEDEEDDGSDKGACICIEGYVRSRRGVCMPAEKCPSCGGDNNATVGCGINCGRRCSDYEKEVQCIAVCYENGCDCRDNFVLDELTGKCVLPEDCTRKNPSKIKNSCSKICNKNGHNNVKRHCKSDSNEEDGSKESDSDEQDNDGNWNEDNNTGVSTTSKPSSSSKCFDEAFKFFRRALFAFSGKLLKELMRSKPGENVMATSPVVLDLLAQVGLSANGEAYTQIMATLNFNNVEFVKCFFKRIIPIVLNIKSVEYRLIGKIYSDTVCPLTRNFRKQTKEIFSFEPENLDFQNPQSARIISQEVADQTRNRIVDYIKPEFLSTLSGTVMISAEYFRGKWQKQFDPIQTKEMDFYVSTFKTIKVRTMRQKGTFLYAESSQLNAKILFMKYVGDVFNFGIILPNSIEGIRGVVDKIRDPDLMMSVLDSLKMRNVEIYLPTFNMTVANRLRRPAERLNITKIFHNQTAGLEDLTPCSGTYVSNILQKATLQIDEFGEGHSKTTDFDTQDSSPEEDNPRLFTFKADHPFIYGVYYYKAIVYFGAYLQ